MSGFLSGVMMGTAIVRRFKNSISQTPHHAKGQGGQHHPHQQDQPHHQEHQQYQLVAKTTGRRRYHILSLVNNRLLATLLETKLRAISGLTEVRASDLTGSLIISYTLSEEKVDDLIEKVAKIIKPTVPPLYDTFSSSVQNIQHQTDLAVHKTSHGMFKFSSLLSLLFIIRGIRRMVVYDEKPDGPTLIWWAFQLVKGW